VFGVQEWAEVHRLTAADTEADEMEEHLPGLGYIE
jgi:hypothetical protein